MKSILTIACMLIATLLSQGLSIAQDANSAALETFATPDVIGIAYVDLNNMDLNESLELLGSMGFKETINYKKMQEQTSIIEAEIEKLKEAGISRGYVLLRMSDLQARGTSFVFPLDDGADAKKSQTLLESMIGNITGGPNYGSNYQAGFRDGALFVGEKENFERLKNEVASDNSDRTEMWKAIDGGSMGVVIFGDSDSRRVVKEMMPALPGPFAKLDGDLLAEGTKWIGLSAKLDSAPALKFEIEAADEESAASFEGIIKNALKMAKFAPQVREVIPKSEIKFVFDAISPKRDGTRVSMSASKLTKDLDRLAKVLAPQVKLVRQAAVKTQLKNTLRQHILSILNFESALQRFPTQYSVDADGKPLLSWRVHVLPYLAQDKLYKEFKLDEPWDSEHNIKLVEKMPEIFWDMRGESFESNKKGLTRFQVPAGEGMVFNAANEIGFRDITDGSSNTISVVAMPMKNAVPWTKPVDWNVDLENPFVGIKDEAEAIIVAFCDGSIHEVPESFPADEFRKLLQHQDGEIVDSKALSR